MKWNVKVDGDIVTLCYWLIIISVDTLDFSYKIYATVLWSSSFYSIYMSNFLCLVKKGGIAELIRSEVHRVTFTNMQ